MDFTDAPFHDYAASESLQPLPTAIRVHTLAITKVLNFLDKY